MVPETHVWNYSFVSNTFDSEEEYKLKIDQPLGFFNELHRPIHFDAFSKLEDHNIQGGDYSVEAEQEDVFI